MKAIAIAAILSACVTASLGAQDTSSVPVDTSYVEYHESPIGLPLGIGLRVPSYDRVNGVTLPWGPRLDLGEDKLQVDALVSYRSNLGKWDPSLEGTAHPGQTNEIKLYVGRGTFTNDSWIRSDLVNSFAALFVGSDARNYYRGDRATLRVGHSLTKGSLEVTPFIGGNLERDWSTGSLAPVKTPWSFFGRTGVLRMRRPNPTISKGRINSMIGGSALEFVQQAFEAKLDASVEHAFKAPSFSCSSAVPLPACTNEPFTQTTIHSTVKFPTFGTQKFEFLGHAVLAGGDPLPPQRFAYLGGAGTLATVNLLALGGDNLLYVQGDYTIPINIIQLPFVGGPFVALRYAAGNAGVGRIPPLIQNVGVAVGVGPLRVDYAIDPASNRNPLSRRSAVTFGVSLPL
ncbi:MAG: hypothetical protein ABR585_02410 [Gemmatimonadaceae bacterium]